MYRFLDLFVLSLLPKQRKSDMKKTIFISLLFLVCNFLCAQTEDMPFKGTFYNEEYQVYLKIDFHSDGLEVPDHEMFGPLPGYLWKKNNSFYWLMTSANVKGKKEAEADLVNDYGSEDLTISLKMKGDSILTLKQGDGSALKIPKKGKWQKLPSSLDFARE